MKDIDFDELDKAVSSVLESGATAADQPSSSVTPVSAVPVTGTDGAEPVSVTTSSASAPAIIPAPPRRSGRFMDVVHPSSDMKTDQKPASERAAVAATGMRLEPLSKDIVPEDPAPAQEAAVATAPVPEKLPVSQPVDPASLVSAADTTDATTWPDPLDVAAPTPAYTGTPEPNSGDTPTLAADAPAVQVMSEPVEQPDEAPKSPFLSDAKVEKRPLGAFSDSPAATTDTASEASDPLTAPDVKPSDDEQLPPQVADKPDEPLPPELSSDLVSLEGTDQGDSAPDGAPAAVEAPTVPQIAVSIPQQYKEAARAESTDDHPVFAPEDHAPLPVTKKKSSPLIWILLIVIVFAIVAGAGAYWYFYLR